MRLHLLLQLLPLLRVADVMTTLLALSAVMSLKCLPSLGLQLVFSRKVSDNFT